jgi:hypothetical protein
VNATDQLTVSPSPVPMPRWRWRVLLLGTLIALCVYYLNYGRAFNEGDNASSPLTLLALALLGLMFFTNRILD